jgi:hypothetical protein
MRAGRATAVVERGVDITRLKGGIDWSGGGTGGIDDVDHRPEIATVVIVDTAAVRGLDPVAGAQTNLVTERAVTGARGPFQGSGPGPAGGRPPAQRGLNAPCSGSAGRRSR